MRDINEGSDSWRDNMNLRKQISSYLMKCGIRKASRLIGERQKHQDGSLQNSSDPTRTAGYRAASLSP